ncbi:S-phase kinase-associated protein 2 [Halyomorpha halys]|uniref:S-phase kinase-associated protein 2 n=1 Tax=Halyomorpha halys TaxID=286706 RepID=UPI0006D514C0|nr:S-phase kinase-associated protein 2 [Halyomorpha halys]
MEKCMEELYYEVNKDKMNELKKTDNNNSFWNISHDLSLDEMKDLGVDVLPEKIGVVPERRKRERSGKNEDFVYNDLAACEAREYEETRKCKLIKSDQFIYRQKLKALNISNDVFSTLSDEIVLGIFNYFSHEDLKVTAQVSRRFRRLAYDESLWPRIDLASKSLSSNSLAYIMKRGVKVLRLKEAKVHSPVWSKQLSFRMSDFYSKIEYLDMSYCLITTEDLAIFLSKCRNLKKLSLESCELSVEVCSEIAKNRDLNTLNFAMVEGLDREGLQLICSNCKRMESINLAWTKLNKDAVNMFVESITSEISSLNLSGLQYSLNDDQLAILMKRCSNIKELDISDCLEITSSSMSSIADHLANIKSLSISRCYKIDPKILLNIMEKFSNLRSLNAFRQIGNQEARDLETNYNLLRVNKEYFSTISRPTVGLRRTSIWLVKCRE